MILPVMSNWLDRSSPDQDQNPYVLEDTAMVNIKAGGSNIYPGPVTLGTEEMVFDWSSDAMELEDIPDTPARAFIDANGDIQLLATHYINRRMVGSDLDNLVHYPGIIMNSDQDPVPANYNANEWLQSIYVSQDDTVHALVHNEYIGTMYGEYSGPWMESWYNSITLAESTDNGATYSHASAPNHLVASIPYTYQAMEGSGPAGIFGGSNIIKNPNDNYYYFLVHLEVFGYQDWGVGVMRTNNLTDPTSWRAWNGIGFNANLINPYTEGAFDPVDHVFQPVSRDNISKMSSSLTYNTYFNKFLVVGMRNDGPGGRPDGIYYSLSEDLINWTPDQLIMECETWWNNDVADSKHHYPSVIDPDSPGRNFEYSDKDVYLYYTLWHDDDPSTTYNRDLVRIPVSFSNVSNYAPNRPNCLFPENLETDVSITPTLEASSYFDPDYNPHNASQWQITTTAGNYSSPIFDSGWNTTALEVINVPINLSYSTTYNWRVRYQDNESSISLWSKELSFSTMAPNDPPVQPVGESPPNGTVGVGNTDVSLQSSVYSDPNGHQHTASRWQMTTTAGDYSSPVFDSGTDTVNLEFIMIPQILELNTTHYWRICHQDEHGAWSDWSDEVHFTTETPSPPSAPTGFSAATVSSSEIGLDWNDHPEQDVNHYCVYRSQSPGVECNATNLVANVSGRLNSDYTDSGLSGTTVYYYRVTAVDDSGSESDPSAEDSAVTMNDTIPGAPTNLTVDWVTVSDTIFLDEAFSDSVPPTGWAVEDPTGSWSQSWSSGAGGTSPEAKLTHPSSSHIDTWRLYAGPLDTTNMISLNMTWDNYYHDWGGEPDKVTVKIQTSSDSLIWQDTTWSHTSGGGSVGPGLEHLTIITSDVGSNTFYVSFTVDGDAFDMEYWYLDNVYLNYTAVSTQYNNMLNWTLSSDDGAGDNDIDHYNIYRSNTSLGPWDMTTLITDVPAGTDTYSDTGRGELDGIDWWYVVRAVDLSSNEDTNTVAVSESGGSPLTSYDIPISPAAGNGDWVFVSFPYTISGNIETVLDDSILGDGGTTWDVAKWYDPQDTADPWKAYRAGVSTSDLVTINNHMGIWLHLTANGGNQLLTTGVAGSYSAGAVNISLYAGWNLVSYPSATSRLASTTLPGAADMVAYYNSGAPYLVTEALPTAVTFSEGNAYWVHMTSAATWTVNP